MIYVTLFIVFGLGISFINVISMRFSILEKIGFSFPLGLGLITFIMFLLNIFGIKFNIQLLLGCATVCACIFNVISWRKDDFNDAFQIKIPEELRNFSVFKINLPWILMFAVFGYLVYGIAAKTMFWQTIAFDSIAGYDLMAKVAAVEGRFDNSLFDKVHQLGIIRCAYPPLVSGSFSLAYMSGLEKSKIMTLIFFLANIISFYPLLKKYATHTSAMFFTLLMVSTPEMLGQSALSLTNVPQAVYSSMGLISLFIWFDKQDIKYFWLGTILIAFNAWTRNDGIAFIAGCGILMLFYSIRMKSWKQLVIYGIITAIPFISWTIFTRSFVPANATDIFKDELFWDTDKIKEMWTLINNILFSTQLYGILFYLFVIVIAINLYYLIKTHDKAPLLLLIFSSLFIYTIIYYQIDHGSVKFGDPLWAMIQYSYKRGMFAFIPAICFYLAVNKVMDIVFRKIM